MRDGQSVSQGFQRLILDWAVGTSRGGGLQLQAWGDLGHFVYRV